MPEVHATKERGGARAEARWRMKKAMNLVMEEQEVIELMRILMDEDAEAALAFLKRHFKGKARELLEGG